MADDPCTPEDLLARADAAIRESAQLRITARALQASTRQWIYKLQGTMQEMTAVGVDRRTVRR